MGASMGSGRHDGSRDRTRLLVAVGMAALPATVAVASGAGSIVSPTRSRYRARHVVCAIGGNRSDPSLVLLREASARVGWTFVVATM